MRKGFSALLLCLSLNTLAAHELLYIEKDAHRSKQDRDIIVKSLAIPRASLESVREQMLATGKYKFVEINSVLFEDIPQEQEDLVGDNTSALPWHFLNINAHKVTNLSFRSSREVVVAVCDSGLEENHADLLGKSVLGYSFVDNPMDTSPNTHHGTMVAGIIVGEYNSKYNTSGIAPQVKIMPLRITTKKGSTTLKTIVDCIKYAADNGAKVINVSFTGVNNDSIEEAGLYARKRGSLLVYSAGNQGRNRKSWPDHKNVLIVGGTEKVIGGSVFDSTRWNCNKWYMTCGSNFGDFVDVVAPARSIFTTRAYVTFGGKKYSNPNGTSFSAPIVSGIAALIFSINPNFTPAEVERIIKSSTRKVGSGSEYVYGAGTVDAEKAVMLAISEK